MRDLKLTKSAFLKRVILIPWIGALGEIILRLIHMTQCLLHMRIFSWEQGLLLKNLWIKEQELMKMILLNKYLMKNKTSCLSKWWRKERNFLRKVLHREIFQMLHIDCCSQTDKAFSKMKEMKRFSIKRNSISLIPNYKLQKLFKITPKPFKQR